MTFSARSLKLPLMKVVVTVPTIGLNRLVMTIFMAAITADQFVSPGELELADAVIKNWDLPVFKCLMAMVAPRLFELLTMDIRMAVSTFTLGIILKLSAIWMTTIAAFILMLTLERKSCSRMIKMCFVPRDGRVAIATRIVPKSVAMWIEVGMTGPTRGVDRLIKTIRMT